MIRFSSYLLLLLLLYLLYFFVYSDTRLRPLNNTSDNDVQLNLHNDNEILIKSSTNSNISLICELKTNLNSNEIKITWFYYKYENEKFTSKRVKLNYTNGLIKMQTNVRTADGFKILTSRMTLNDLRSTQFGYYMCGVENYQVKSSLYDHKVLDLNINASYFLQIQCKCLWL